MGNRISDCSDGSESHFSEEEPEELSSSVYAASESARDSFLDRQDGDPAGDISRLWPSRTAVADKPRERGAQSSGAYDGDGHEHSNSTSPGGDWNSAGVFPGVNARPSGRKWRRELGVVGSLSPSSRGRERCSSTASSSPGPLDHTATADANSDRPRSPRKAHGLLPAERVRTPERRPADSASLPRWGGRCREADWRGDDDSAFFSPVSRPPDRRHHEARLARAVRPRVAQTAGRGSVDAGACDERPSKEPISSAFSSTGEKTENESHFPEKRSRGARQLSSYDQRPILGCHASSWHEAANVPDPGSQRVYADGHPVSSLPGDRGRKRTRDMRLEEEREQHLERALRDPAENMRTRDGEDNAWRQGPPFPRRQNAAYSSVKPDGSCSYPSHSLPSSQISAREEDSGGTGMSLPSYSKDAPTTGRSVREVAEEKAWASDEQTAWMCSSPSDRSGAVSRIGSCQTRTYPCLSPEKGSIYSTRRMIGRSFGQREGELETPSPVSSLRQSPRKRETGDIEYANAASSRNYQKRTGQGHDDAVSSSGPMTEGRRREEATEEGRSSHDCRSRGRDKASFPKSSLYAHVQHRVPSHRVPSSTGRRTTTCDSSGTRKETDFSSCVTSSGDMPDECRDRAPVVRADRLQVEADHASLHAENELETTGLEARSGPGGGSCRPLEEWTEKLEGALQKLMTQQRMTRLAQNTWKLHGKEISLAGGSAFCLCEEVFGRNRETLPAFFSRREAAWVLPAAEFGDENACSGKDCERLKTSSLQCIHCRVPVHALCGAVASKFPRRPERFYCCLCRILLFDPSSEVTWCSSIASLACPAHYLSEEDPAGPPALIPSLAGRCVLPFSHSPVLQRELASSPSAALELRFFPMDDPTCGRHRPYIPDRLQIFFNPRVRALTAPGMDSTPVSLRKRGGCREVDGRSERDGFISYPFSESTPTGPGRGGRATPTLRMSPRKSKIGLDTTRTCVSGFDCSVPDFQALYDPVVPHLHPKPPLYLSDIKRHARLKSGMNYVVARGQHREGRLFLVQLVCSLPVEESQLLEAIVQRRSLPIPYCTDFLKWLVAQKRQRRVSTSSDEVEIFGDSLGPNRLSGEDNHSVLESPRSRRSSVSLATLRGTRGYCVRDNVRNEDRRGQALNDNGNLKETPSGRGFWSAIIERLPGFRRKKTEASPQGSTTASASQSPLPPVLTLSLFSDDIAGRLRTPVRSVHCRHPECFDLQFYVRTNYLRHCAKSSWKCPLCEEYAFPHELYVDTLVQEILHMTDFSPPKRKAKVVSFHSADLEKYVVDEWCDEDDYEDLGVELSGW
uniref:MIZ zinc finger protein, putative n=1 Tax=Neospora caninum (strain Liverpool) TaxID=572307 RepID=A0A0F7UAQ6_NEOCL|nr:TPA: MIZ zinc finger protein, putative [Neospora caninum Liverpool]